MKLPAWLEYRRHGQQPKERGTMDHVTIESIDRKKVLHGMKMLEEGQPILEMRISRKDGQMSYYLCIRPADAGRLADWMLDPVSGGWTPQPGPGVPQPESAVTPAEAQQRRQRDCSLLLYVLNCLVWKLPKEYGAAWLAGELAAAGIQVEWVDQQERFRFLKEESKP